MNTLSRIATRRFALAPLFASLLLAGCATAPALDLSTLPAIPASFKEASSGQWTSVAPAEAQARGDWWKAFADPALDALIAQATSNNTSVQQAAARLAQATAQLRGADADRTPQVSVGANASRQRDVVTGDRPYSLYGLGANLSYEVDLFGRLTGASKAAGFEASSSAALLRSTQLLVQSQVAQTYLALRALDEERALVRQTVGTYRDTQNLTERRFKAGDLAELDVVRVRTQVATTESDALALDRQRAALEHALAALVGATATHFAVVPAGWDAALPVIPANVPGTVLARRPDVSAALNSLLAAQQRLGVAKTAFFPNITLTAQGGTAATDIADVLAWSARSWGIGALLSLPVFDGGKREAGVQSAQAVQDFAMAGYREQILVAFRDVEDQLSALSLLAAQSEAQGRAVASSSHATALSNTRYRNGFIGQLDLLDAQRSELANRRQAVQVKSAQYQATVGLIRALGGSWDNATEVSAR